MRAGISLCFWIFPVRVRVPGRRAARPALTLPGRGSSGSDDRFGEESRGAVMHAINSYILRQLIGVTVFVTLGLTSAIWLTQSLRLIDYIVNRGLEAATFLTFIGLLLPSFLGIVLPISALQNSAIRPAEGPHSPGWPISPMGA